MTDELLHEIKETLKGARLGYGSVSSQTYVKHVVALLQYQELAEKQIKAFEIAMMSTPIGEPEQSTP